MVAVRLGCLSSFVSSVVILLSHSYTARGDRKIHLQADTTSVVFYPNLDDTVTSNLSLLFDGLLQQAITGVPVLSGCPTTTPSLRPWIRLDLKELFSVKRITVSFLVGEVRVGNSLTKSGLDNYQCDTAEIIGAEHCRDVPCDFECNIPQLARYIIITRTALASTIADNVQVQLAVCEIELFVHDDPTGVSDVRPVLHLHHLNETGVTAEGGPTTVPGSPVHLSIDGNISTCAITNTLATPLPWLRIDLQRSYRINSILAMLSDSSGTAGVRYSSFVGENIDSLTGSDANQYCNALLIDGPSQWYRFRCRWPLKGRYVTLNLNDSGTAPKQLVVCELQIFYELDIEITYKQMIATSLTVTVDEGCSLPHPVECSVTPSDSSLNKDISLFWLFPNGSEVPSDGRIRQRSHVTQMLWILTASFGKDSGYYACRYTTNKKHRSTGFSLNVRAVDCRWGGWSECSSCGESMRYRTAEITRSKNGQACQGPSSEPCSVNLPPCAPEPVALSVTVDEGQTATLQCTSDLSRNWNYQNATIRILWFRDNNGTILLGNAVREENRTDEGILSGSLVFRSISRSDNGVYRCQAVSQYGATNSSQEVTLTVQFAPTFRIQPQSAHVRLGSEHTMHCIADGIPRPTYTWINLDTGMPVAVTETRGAFSFKSVSLDDSGNYTCLAENDLTSGRRVVASPLIRISVEDFGHTTPDAITRHVAASCTTSRSIMIAVTVQGGLLFACFIFVLAVLSHRLSRRKRSDPTVNSKSKSTAESTMETQRKYPLPTIAVHLSKDTRGLPEPEDERGPSYLSVTDAEPPWQDENISDDRSYITMAGGLERQQGTEENTYECLDKVMGNVNVSQSKC